MGLEAQAWHDRELLSPCFKPQTIGGTTGAGDAIVAGLLAALLRGAGPSDAATIATAVGAFSVEGPDPASAVPALEHVSQRLADGWSRLPVLLELPADLICN
jgi:sugar/nucleoside kinase (ribokinase family)